MAIDFLLYSFFHLISAVFIFANLRSSLNLINQSIIYSNVTTIMRQVENIIFLNINHAKVMINKFTYI